MADQNVNTLGQSYFIKEDGSLGVVEDAGFSAIFWDSPTSGWVKTVESGGDLSNSPNINPGDESVIDLSQSASDTWADSEGNENQA